MCNYGFYKFMGCEFKLNVTFHPIEIYLLGVTKFVREQESFTKCNLNLSRIFQDKVKLNKKVVFDSDDDDNVFKEKKELKTKEELKPEAIQANLSSSSDLEGDESGETPQAVKEVLVQEFSTVVHALRFSTQRP